MLFGMSKSGMKPNEYEILAIEVQKWLLSLAEESKQEKANVEETERIINNDFKLPAN